MTAELRPRPFPVDLSRFIVEAAGAPTLLEFGNFAKGDFSEFADASGANYGPSTGRTTIQDGGPNGGKFARLHTDDKSHLYNDLANNRIHLIGFAGGIPSWFKNGQRVYGAISMRVPTIAGVNSGYVYSGLEIHGDNGTGPAPWNTPFQRGSQWSDIARGGSETNGAFDSQWEFGQPHSAVDAQHHHQDWAGGNKPTVADEWLHQRFDWLLDPKAGEIRVQGLWSGLPGWRDTVPLRTGVPTSYPDKNGDGLAVVPMLSLYQATGYGGVQVLDYAAGCFASTAAERDAWQDARLGLTPTPPAPVVDMAAALAATKTAISELEQTDAWKLYHDKPTTHTYKSHVASVAARKALGG